jgi:hypothetical protein
MQKAIREKDERFAQRTAAFAQGTNTNPTAGAKAFDMNMLRYYDAVQDTTNYCRKSIAYYERYFLSVSVDSIKRTDSLNLQRMLKSAAKDTVREGDRVRLISKVAYAPVGQRFSAELNDGAYGFYLRTSNPYLLSIATEWAKHALALYATPEAYSTYAKLLYKQNQKEAATEAVNNAIALQQKRGLPAKLYEQLLEKMRRNETLTD